MVFALSGSKQQQTVKTPSWKHFLAISSMFPTNHLKNKSSTYYKNNCFGETIRVCVCVLRKRPVFTKAEIMKTAANVVMATHTGHFNETRPPYMRLGCFMKKQH